MSRKLRSYNASSERPGTTRFEFKRAHLLLGIIGILGAFFIISIIPGSISVASRQPEEGIANLIAPHEEARAWGRASLTEDFTILALGVAGGDNISPNLTDAILLIHIKDGARVSVFSLPRDLYVESPESHVFRKINDLYRTEGIASLRSKVEEITGVSINAHAIIDLRGVGDIVEITRAKELGVDVIICDHHLAPEVNPPALAVLNPKALDTTYPFPYLSGTGVAFKLAHGVLKSLSPEVRAERGIQEGFEKWLLDLVAIATVADIMPLQGENRTLVKYGLMVIGRTKKLGLRMLIEKTGILPTFGTRRLVPCITTRDLGFTLIPRINAMGRIAHASTSFELMVTESEDEAIMLVAAMEEKNQDRVRMVEEAIISLEKTLQPDAQFIFASFDDSALPGILSSISNKMADKHRKPVFLLARQAEKSFGSVRSGGFFNCVEILKTTQELLLGFGGHPFAAGFSISNDQIPALKEKLAVAVAGYLKGDQPPEEFPIDGEVAFDEAGIELLEDLEKFEPFGQGNLFPRLLMRNVVIKDYKFVGSGEKHVKFTLMNPHGDTSDTRSAIAFFMGSNVGTVHPGDRIDLVFELERDRYRGGKHVSLKVVDFDYLPISS